MRATNGRCWIIGALVLVSGSTCTPRRLPEPSDRASLAIYALILEAASEDLRETSRVVVNRSFPVLPSDAPLLDAIPDIPGLGESFAAANQEAGQLSSEDAQVLGIQFFEPARFRREESDTDLDRWYAEVAAFYGGDGIRIVSLSRPGFSADGDTAVIDYTVSCGARCGEGRLAILERQRDGWQIVASHLMLRW